MLLAGTLLGMVLRLSGAPLALLSYPWHGSGVAAALGAAAWLLMSLAISPTLRLYRQPLWLAPLLPVARCLYCAMTVDSALSPITAAAAPPGRAASERGVLAAGAGGGATAARLPPIEIAP